MARLAKNSQQLCGTTSLEVLSTVQGVRLHLERPFILLSEYAVPQLRRAALFFLEA